MAYRPDDIERYLSGGMTPAEQHALEEQALRDPFLQDALEGASFLAPQQLAADKQLMRKRFSHTAPTRAIALRVAAGFALLAGAAYLVWYVTSSTQRTPEPLAQQEIEAAADTIVPAAPQVAPAESRTEPTVARATDDGPPATRQTELRAQRSEQPGAGGQTTRLAEIDDTLRAAQALAAPTASGLGPTVNYRFSMEVETISKDMRAGEPAQSKEALTLDASTAASGSTVAAPSVGLGQYQRYLSRAVGYPEAALLNKVSGEAVVSFIVEPDQRLTNFTVEKALGYGCEEALTRAISQGPAWRVAVQNHTPVASRVSVAFEFVLPR